MTQSADKMSDRRTDMAVDWLMRRTGGPLSAADAQAFEVWLDEDPDHRRAYQEVEWLWAAAGAAEGLPRIEARRRWALRSASRGGMARRAIAASLVAVVLGIGGLGLHSTGGPKPLATQSFRTGVGQQATVTLPDGSVVTLNTDTVVRTRADVDRRLVYLDKGQAFFRVARDRRHAFVVNAAGRTVTALGTAFDVRIDDGALKVVLVEGKVRVEAARPARSPASGAAPPKVGAAGPMQQATEMSAGSQLVATGDADWRLTRTNVESETSWLNRQIIFDDEALGDIVAEMNRYSARKMIVDDPALARRRLSGIYTIGDLAAFSEALRGYGVAELEEDPHGAIHVVALR